MQISRRQALFSMGAAFPAIVPSRVFGQSAPSNLIQVGQLGCGRIGRSSEMPGLLKNSGVARIVAVCDLDSVRLADGKAFVEAGYRRTLGEGKFASVKTYANYRDMLADKSIDAITISTPDHWHAQQVVEAVLAGKDVYVQKPASLTISEGRMMADAVRKSGRILQMGSQQRSDPAFRLACELVRNGRIGKIKEVFVGLPVDPGGPAEPPQTLPRNLDYDMWLGSTPQVYYTENRVHPQSDDPKKRYDRPGWLRCEQFGAGMITGWGSHHIDIAHWAMNVELSGPVEIEASAEFPKSGLWDVHGPFHVKARYANGATMYISDKFTNGVRFIGEDGWIWVTRGRYLPGERNDTLNVHDARILKEGIKDNELHLHASPNNDHHLDWLTSVRTRKPPVTSAEIGHRSCTACLLAHAAMKLDRVLHWDPEKERFVNDAQANVLLSRPQRAPYGVSAVLAQRG
jgi:predicted dehydrogenase